MKKAPTAVQLERRQELLAWLEEGAPHKNGVDAFNMAAFMANCACGTVACLAGATIQFAAKKQKKSYEALCPLSFFEPMEGKVAGALLGIPQIKGEVEQPEMVALFGLGVFTNQMSKGGRLGWMNDPKVAANVVRYWMTTGEVRWDLFKPEGAWHHPTSVFIPEKGK